MPIPLLKIAAAFALFAVLLPAKAQAPGDAVEALPSTVLASASWREFVAAARDRSLVAPDIDALEKACVAAVGTPSSSPPAAMLDRCLVAAAAALPIPARYMNAEEAELSRSSTALRPFGAIGVELWRRVPRSGPVVVVAPLRDSPAERAGILRGDAIERINGADITALSMEQAVLGLRGKPGSVIEVSLLRGDPSQRVTLSIPLAVIHTSAVTAKAIGTGVLYTRIRWFNQDTAGDLARDLQRVAAVPGIDARNLVLDLRGCYGGSLESALPALASFVPAGTTVGWMKTRAGMQALDVPASTEAAGTVPGVAAFRLPVLVLIDTRTAEAAELFALALHQFRGAMLVGERSAGLTDVDYSNQLPNGGRIRLKEGELLSARKVSWKGVGLELDRLASSSHGRFEYGDANDQALAQALMMLPDDRK